MNLLQIEEGFVSWIQATSQGRGLTRMALRDQMRDLGAGVHPKTVETWFRGTAMPAYANLVALALLFHELPPPLARLCPGRIELGEAGEDRLLDISDTAPDPEDRPNPGSPPS